MANHMTKKWPNYYKPTSPVHAAERDIEPFKGTPLASYYDYFVSAANAYIYISATDTTITRELDDLPFLAISWSTQQTQKPIYGFWDRTPRAFAPGRSLTTGMFVIPHTYVNRLEELLMSSDVQYNTANRLNEKEVLREKYWGTRDWANVPADPDRKGFPGDSSKNIFYAAPMFDISIIYGTGDDVTLGSSSFNLDSMLALDSAWHGTSDVNALYRPGGSSDETSSFSYQDKGQRETITGVKIMGKEKSINVGGQPIAEQFSFIARQVIPE